MFISLPSFEHLRIQVKILESKLESLGGKVFQDFEFLETCDFLTD